MRITLIALIALAVSACATTDATISGNEINGHLMEMDDRFVSAMTSPAYKNSMPRNEIIERSSYCASRHLSSGAVQLSGGSQPLVGGSEVSTDQGGNVLQRVDAESGLLVARSRTDYRRAMIPYSAEATIMVEAKDGRYRLVYSNLRYAQKTTGYIRNNGFSRISRHMGSGWQAALVAILGTGEALSECIASNNSDW